MPYVTTGRLFVPDAWSHSFVAAELEGWGITHQDERESLVAGFDACRKVGCSW